MTQLAPGFACAALLSLAAAAGCGGTVSAGTGAGGSGSSSSAATGATSSSSSASTSSGSPSCAATSTTTLAGAHLEIDASQCTFSLADPVAKIDFPYRVVIDQDIAGVTARAQDGGMCGDPGPSGLIPFEKVDGNQQMYCICDLGKCAPTTGTPVTLKQGSYPATFTWDKHNWFGPSDTGNPEGPVFPVGDYTVTVSAIGIQASPTGDVGFVITATLPIHLVP
jgi:hypothetical protein